MNLERSLRKAARSVKDFFNDLRAIEVRHAGEVWAQYKRCPMKEGALPCPGTLVRSRVGSALYLACNTHPTYHYIEVHLTTLGQTSPRT